LEEKSEIFSFFFANFLCFLFSRAVCKNTAENEFSFN